MNEQQTAYAIARHLDGSVDQLPAPVLDRLRQARTSALAELADNSTTSPKQTSGWLEFDRPSFWSRAALATVPLVVLTAGLVGLAQWQEDRRSVELADDAAWVARQPDAGVQ